MRWAGCIGMHVCLCCGYGLRIKEKRRKKKNLFCTQFKLILQFSVRRYAEKDLNFRLRQYNEHFCIAVRLNFSKEAGQLPDSQPPHMHLQLHGTHTHILCLWQSSKQFFMRWKLGLDFWNRLPLFMLLLLPLPRHHLTVCQMWWISDNKIAYSVSAHLMWNRRFHAYLAFDSSIPIAAHSTYNLQTEIARRNINYSNTKNQEMVTNRFQCVRKVQKYILKPEPRAFRRLKQLENVHVQLGLAGSISKMIVCDNFAIRKTVFAIFEFRAECQKCRSGFRLLSVAGCWCCFFSFSFSFVALILMAWNEPSRAFMLWSRHSFSLISQLATVFHFQTIFPSKTFIQSFG